MSNFPYWIDTCKACLTHSLSYFLFLQCLSAGSYIAHREAESDDLRPYAAHLTESIHRIRMTLRKHVQSKKRNFSESLVDLLRWFDHTWAEFEFRYVSIMCPVMSAEEFDQIQEVTISFIEATKRYTISAHVVCICCIVNILIVMLQFVNWLLNDHKT